MSKKCVKQNSKNNKLPSKTYHCPVLHYISVYLGMLALCFEILFVKTNSLDFCIKFYLCPAVTIA